MELEQFSIQRGGVRKIVKELLEGALARAEGF
jgi:hypothetical protein